MRSDVRSIIGRNDPGRWSRPLAHRPKADLPFDPLQIPAGVTLLFDATVYIDQLKGQLPTSIVNLMASRTILHGAPALAELAVTIGALDLSDRRTHAALIPIVEMLSRINPSRIIALSYEVWLEAAVTAGILARTPIFQNKIGVNFSTTSCFFCRHLIAAPSWSAEIPVISIYYCN